MVSIFYRSVVEMRPPWEVEMWGDGRDILDVLKFELSFLEQGGYGRSVRTPSKPTSIFQDTFSCINFNDPERSDACRECLFTDLAPERDPPQAVPCHSIPLNTLGETVDSMKRQYNQSEMEDAVKNWLRDTIRRIEEEREQKKASISWPGFPEAS